MDTASQSSPQILQILNPSSSTGIIANVGPMFSTSSSSLPSSVAIVSTTAAATSSTTNIAASNKQVRLNLGNQNFILVPAGSNLLSGVTGGLNSAIANNQNVTNLIASHHNSIVNKGKIMILTTASNPNLMGASTASSGTILTHQNTLNNSPQQSQQQQQQQVIRLNQIPNLPGSGGSTAPIFTLNSNASGGVPIASKSLPSSIISPNSVNSNNSNHPQNIIIATTNTNNNSHLNYQHFKSISVGSPHQQSQPQFQILSTPTQNYQPQCAVSSTGSMSPVNTGLARFQSNQVSINRNAFSIKSSYVANKANLRQPSQIIQTQPSKPSAAQLPDTNIVLNGTIEQEPEIIQSSVSVVPQVISAQTSTVQVDNSASSAASGSTSSLSATITNITNQSRIETKVVETDKIMTVAESINNAKSQEVIEIDDEEEEEEMDDEEIMEINYNGDQCNELDQQSSKMMNVDTIDCAELDEDEGPDSSFEERAKNLYSDELLDRSSPELWPEKVPGVVKFLSGTSPTYFPKDDADDLLLPKTEENQKNSFDLKVVVKKETTDSDSVSGGAVVNPNSVTTTPTRRQQSRKQSFVKKLNKSFSITPYGLASTNSRLPDYSRKQLNCFNSNNAPASSSNANCENGLGSSGTLAENDPIHHSDDSSTTSAHNFSLDNSVGKSTTKNNNNSSSSACGGGKIVITKVPDWQKELDEDEIAMLYGYGSLTASALLDKVKEIQNLSYQLGLEEEREMTRARFLNIFNHYNQDEPATPYSKRSNLIFSAEKEINFNSNDNYGEFFPRHLSEFGPGMLNNLNVSSTGSTK